MVPLLAEVGATRLALVLSFLVLQIGVVIASMNARRLTRSIDAIFWISGAGLLSASLGLDSP
jgi:hypothetical protein